MAGVWFLPCWYIHQALSATLLITSLWLMVIKHSKSPSRSHFKRSDGLWHNLSAEAYGDRIGRAPYAAILEVEDAQVHAIQPERTDQLSFSHSYAGSLQTSTLLLSVFIGFKRRSKPWTIGLRLQQVHNNRIDIHVSYSLVVRIKTKQNNDSKSDGFCYNDFNRVATAITK